MRAFVCVIALVMLRLKQCFIRILTEVPAVLFTVFHFTVMMAGVRPLRSRSVILLWRGISGYSPVPILWQKCIE